MGYNMFKEGVSAMQYLVQLRLASSGRKMSPREGVAFIEELIFPTLERCRKLQEEKEILAGGPMSGAVSLALIVTAESAQELDDLITGLPIWPRMETEVIPLTTFERRKQSLLPRLAELKAQKRQLEKSRTSGGR
jgi:muconolactone delta-isomerase